MASSVHADFRSLDRARGNALLGIESQQWQVQNDCKPVAVDHKEEGKEGVDTSFGDNVGVESVAQIDRVDIVAATGKISKKPLDSPREMRCLLARTNVYTTGARRYIPLEITVHDSEEDLQEQVDGVDQHRQ